MKAIRLKKYGPPKDAFEEVEIAKPEIAEDEVLIKVEGFGINFADIMARKGLYKDAPELPFIPGYEAVGEIIETGNQVDKKLVGKRVIAMTRFGAYATLTKTKAIAVAVINQRMPLAIALTLATQYVTAYYAMEELANLRPNDKVLVHAGAGGVGLALLDIARYKQLEVYATASKAEKIDLINSLSAKGINYQKENYADRIRTLSQKDRPLKATFNAIGGKTFKKDLSLLHPGGTTVLYGAAARTNDGKGLLPTLKLLWNFGLILPLELLMRSISVNGLNLLKVADHDPVYVQRMLNNIIQLVEEDKLSPYEGTIYPAKEIHEAHLAIENRATIGKIGVRW